MQVNTSDLTDIMLDWAVATAAGAESDFEDGECYLTFEHDFGTLRERNYHDNWKLTGPILHREGIGFKRHSSPARGRHYAACQWNEDGNTGRFPQAGTTELEAALRVFVESRLGAVVEIPEELCALPSAD